MTSTTMTPRSQLPATPKLLDAGLTVHFIDGNHITLMALGSLDHSGAVAHRLTTLITAGVRHISIDLRQVREVAPPTIACLTDIAFHLSDSGGTLELINVAPAVAAAIAQDSNS
jgi:ABC-type transporter Mla MlaB component